MVDELMPVLNKDDTRAGSTSSGMLRTM